MNARDFAYAAQIALAATTATLAETRSPWKRGYLAQQAQSYRVALRIIL